MNLELFFEAISGLAMVAAGGFLAVGYLIRHRRLGAHEGVYRAAGIVFSVLLALYGVYVLNLARQGYVLVKGAGVVRSR